MNCASVITYGGGAGLAAGIAATMAASTASVSAAEYTRCVTLPEAASRVSTATSTFSLLGEVVSMALVSVLSASATPSPRLRSAL